VTRKQRKGRWEAEGSATERIFLTTFILVHSRTEPSGGDAVKGIRKLDFEGLSRKGDRRLESYAPGSIGENPQPTSVEKT